VTGRFLKSCAVELPKGLTPIANKFGQKRIYQAEVEPNDLSPELLLRGLSSTRRSGGTWEVVIVAPFILRPRNMDLDVPGPKQHKVAWMRTQLMAVKHDGSLLAQINNCEREDEDCERRT
jgi:hypothetical protein